MGWKGYFVVHQIGRFCGCDRVGSLSSRLQSCHIKHSGVDADRKLTRWVKFQSARTTSRAHPGHKIYPYLLRKLTITRSNQVWALDTTYIAMERGFVYLTAVVDVASRKVLAHKVAITLEACHAKEVIEQAFLRHGTPQIVNTDQGSQFTATEFTDVLLARGCKLSMDGRGAWRDNVFVERFWRSVKYERVYLKAYDSVSAARTDIAQYIEGFNVDRPHLSLDDATPDEFYFANLPTMGEAA